MSQVTACEEEAQLSKDQCWAASNSRRVNLRSLLIALIEVFGWVGADVWFEKLARRWSTEATGIVPMPPRYIREAMYVVLNLNTALIMWSQEL